MTSPADLQVTNTEANNMIFKKVLRYDSSSKLLRLFRLVWHTGTVGDGQGYSSKLSLALTPKLFRFSSDALEWEVILLGLRIHHCRSYGGLFQ